MAVASAYGSPGPRPLGPSDYWSRLVDTELTQALAALPAVSIEGPKGVGKTATAARLASTIRALDDPAQLQVLQAAPDRLTTGNPPVLIDEWQVWPASWDRVRRAVDSDMSPGRFLLTGSASPRSPQTHSGAGRIITLRMRPLTLEERGTDLPTVSLASLLTGSRPAVSGMTKVDLETYVQEIVRGGFPGIQSSDTRWQRAALRSYVDRIVDRDFPDAGLTARNPVALRRWLAAYAAATSTTATFETIRDAASTGQHETPARSTTVPYRDTLERIWVADPVSAWLPTRNQLSRLTSNPKHNLADPALAVALLDMDGDALLAGADSGLPVPRDGPLLGSLLESLVALNLRVYAQAADSTVAHLRTKSGDHEIDFIVRKPGDRVVAIEVKLSTTVTDSDVKHLKWLSDRIGNDLLDAVVLTTGPEAYRRNDGIAVVPIALLGH